LGYSHIIADQLQIGFKTSVIQKILKSKTGGNLKLVLEILIYKQLMKSFLNLPTLPISQEDLSLQRLAFPNPQVSITLRQLFLVMSEEVDSIQLALEDC